jgi:hypothetical protein
VAPTQPVKALAASVRIAINLRECFMKQQTQKVKIRTPNQTEKPKTPGIKLQTGIKAGAWDTAAYGDKSW